MHSSRMRTARSLTVSRRILRTPPVDRILDTRFWKYYLAPNFVCGRSGRTQVLYKAHVLFCALFFEKCALFL